MIPPEIGMKYEDFDLLVELIAGRDYRVSMAMARLMLRRVRDL